MENLKSLMAINLQNTPIEEIYSLINNIRPLPILKTVYPKGTLLERAQRNCDGQLDFSTVQRMSYAPSNFNTKYLKASTPENTMFYASVVTGNQNQGLARITACCEISELLRDDLIPMGERIITMGTWQVQEPITLATIFDPTKIYTINYLEEIKLAYLTHLNNFSYLKEKGLAYLQFLSKEFSKNVKSGNNHEYYISALFSNLISKTGFDGILYPSVRSAENGLCIALCPAVADGLQLIQVNKCLIQKKDGEISISYLKRCNVVPNSETFKLLDLIKS
ncbi:RES domain-containing protein [Cytophagaceae bacterium 50C-KIRBA]|uniref:RES domain-containing protein n=1 Tax=Aquirufa beregesia TaxID=2516556 RepID=A0ABX0F3P1_9BACT|nr:RES family NAD+ phosphorylase [Aquirufa beregesia]NGZ44475.1 RES domain-containing protein [Aquirufa beregesia]